MKMRALKFHTAFFFFAATAVNLYHGITLAAIFSFLSGSGFIAETLIYLYQTRPAPVRYPTKEGLARLRARLKELRERKPSDELVTLIAPTKAEDAVALNYVYPPKTAKKRNKRKKK